LAQCFDWIAHSITSKLRGSAMQGVPIKVITCLLTTIQFMIFFLCTTHRDSEAFYSATMDKGSQEGNANPYKGSCQRNGGGPALFWESVPPALTICT
jgi:hypothetical protein